MERSTKQARGRGRGSPRTGSRKRRGCRLRPHSKWDPKVDAESECVRSVFWDEVQGSPPLTSKPAVREAWPCLGALLLGAVSGWGPPRTWRKSCSGKSCCPSSGCPCRTGLLQTLQAWLYVEVFGKDTVIPGLHGIQDGVAVFPERTLHVS